MTKPSDDTAPSSADGRGDDPSSTSISSGFEIVSVALEVEAIAPRTLHSMLSGLLLAVVDALPGSAFGHAKALADDGSLRLFASTTVSPPSVNFTPDGVTTVLVGHRASVALTCVLGGVNADDLARAVDAGLVALAQSGCHVRKETRIG